MSLRWNIDQDNVIIKILFFVSSHDYKKFIWKSVNVVLKRVKLLK